MKKCSLEFENKLILNFMHVVQRHRNFLFFSVGFSNRPVNLDH